ncbi:hypothetical protein DZF91_21520 [Actinomadura logoneensis]|uniref:Uncharacterized protein n=1 Tax=Actinomadura logoneensis TaxID=2293572 RepID=A0A372JHX1_9ACTN|nr:hypothetical protein [Actinomadura logoneensis]RFU39622.1 hypothetical protein DZF91_21520 [Actinomadura logoneensis]
MSNTISMNAWQSGAAPCPAFSAAYAGAEAVSVRTGLLGVAAKLGGGVQRKIERSLIVLEGSGLFENGPRLRGLMQQVSRDEQGRSVFAADFAEGAQRTAPATTHVNVTSPEGDESGPYPRRRRPV